MAVTMSGIQKALKNHYKPKMAESVLANLGMYEMLKDTSDAIKRGGRDFLMYWPIHHRHSYGTAGGTEAGDFGTPDTPGIDEWTSGIVRMNSSGAISGDVINAARSQPDLSYLKDPLNFMMDEIRMAMSIVLGYQVFGTGDGSLARIDTSQGAVGADYFYVNNPGSVWIQRGMVIQAYTNNTTGSSPQWTADTSAFQRVADVQRQSNGTYKIIIQKLTGATGDTTGGTTNGYWIYQRGHYGVAGLLGLSAICDDGTSVATYQGQTRSTTAYANAKVFNLNGAPINESALFPIFAEMARRSPSKKITHMVTDHDTLSWLALSVLDRQRFEGQTTRGGFKSVEWHHALGTTTIMADQLCPPGRIFILDADELGLGWGTAPGGEWADEDGSPLNKQPSSSSGTGYKDQYVATWRVIAQMSCNAPENFALIYNYTSP